MNMLFEHIVMPGILVPSVVALVVLVTFQGFRLRGLGGGPAAGAAFLAAFVGLTGWPAWPPIDSNQRLFYLVALAALASLAAALLQKGRLPWVVRGVFLALLLTLILKSKLQNAWGAAQSALWLVGLLLLGLFLIHAWGRSLDREAARGRLLGAAVRLALVGGTAVALGLSGSARLGQLAGALACGMLVVEAVALARGRSRWQRADAVVVVTALYGLLLIGYFYAQLSPWVAMLLVAASSLLALSHSERRLWRLAPLLPLALALGLVVAAAMNQPEDPYDYYSERPAAEESPRLVRP